MSLKRNSIRKYTAKGVFSFLVSSLFGEGEGEGEGEYQDDTVHERRQGWSMRLDI